MDIKACLKTYTLAFLMACFLVVIHTDMEIRSVSTENCGDDQWRLYNGRATVYDNETEVTADVIRGSDSSTLHEINIVYPHCDVNQTCPEPVITAKNVNCYNDTLTDQNEEACDIAEALRKLEHYDMSVSYWRELNFLEYLCFMYYEESTSVI